MSQSVQVAIGANTVRQQNGLFCLNDLHAAAGSTPSQKPSEWLSNQQTKDLVSEIQKAGIPAIESKQKIGTYACRELVIAYAAWISAAFHLKVIRVFLAQQDKPAERICPSCGRRVAVLYAGQVFACRTCLNLTYQSTRAPKSASKLFSRICSKLSKSGQ